MSPSRVLLAVLTALAAAQGAHAVDGWAQLKAGMTRAEAVAVLGAELQASKARGFEVAVYDSRAEVVYLGGQVVAWTAPASSTATASPAGAWQFEQSRRAGAGSSAARRPVETRPTNAAILPAYRL
jgi:hypothetical protein